MPRSGVYKEPARGGSPAGDFLPGWGLVASGPRAVVLQTLGQETIESRNELLFAARQNT